MGLILESLLILLCVILLIFGILVLKKAFNLFIQNIIELPIPKLENIILLFYNLKPSEIQFLESNFHYYANLPNTKHKINFQKRVARFKSQKNFIAKGNLFEISNEMKLLVSASAVKITFGYSKAYLSHFKTIIIFPSDYYSKITKQKHKGEISPNGIIVFSWNNFLDGYQNNLDGINLAIHEFAHSLFFESRFGKLDASFMKYWRYIPRFYLGELNDLKNGVSPYFRNYALENEHEFFSVAVEEFFERPKELYINHPQLYILISKILNQDPSKGNYPKVDYFTIKSLLDKFPKI